MEEVDQMIHEVFFFFFFSLKVNNCNNFIKWLQRNPTHSHKDDISYTYKIEIFINHVEYLGT